MADREIPSRVTASHIAADFIAEHPTDYGQATAEALALLAWHRFQTVVGPELVRNVQSLLAALAVEAEAKRAGVPTAPRPARNFEARLPDNFLRALRKDRRGVDVLLRTSRLPKERFDAIVAGEPFFYDREAHQGLSRLADALHLPAQAPLYVEVK